MREPRLPRVWRGLDLLLGLMIVGPVVAPLFHASGIPLFEWIAHGIIYPLGMGFCPQDQHAVALAGQAMAVCTRCYAAIAGLFGVRLALTSDPDGRGLGPWLARTWRRVPTGGRVAFIVGTIALWQADVWAERLGWWSWDHATLILTGPPIGLAIGFLAYSLLARLTGAKPGWATQARA